VETTYRIVGDISGGLWEDQNCPRPECLARLRDHAEYSFGPGERQTHVDAICPDALVWPVRIVDAGRAPLRWAEPYRGIFEQDVPAETADAALDAAMAAWSGHIVTLDIVAA
jgi:hypothetical protein